MFRTWDSTPANQAAAAAPASPSPAGQRRPKRSQVGRACDWCRVHRVKCDSEQPCRNCKGRGGQCRTTGASEIRTLPHAFREIERLKRRIQELEQEAERQARPQMPSPDSTPPASDLIQSAAVARSGRTDGDVWDLWKEGGQEQHLSAGLYTSNGHKPQKQWFGPSSIYYFISRIISHLGVFLDHPPAEHTIHFCSAEKSITDAAGLGPTRCTDHASDPDTYSLTAMQEEYFLNSFWQSHHCAVQILDEASFKKHYRSLWIGQDTGGKTRRPSTLVDIVLALCLLSSCPPGSSRTTDAVTKDIGAMAARWHYQRCQTLLLSELESPTLSTLQCHIFSVVYLCGASFPNMAHSTLALALRTAHILGLHLEPPKDLPRPERELRKRVWWTLYNIESKTCMKLGRPWSAPLSDTTCSLPADDHQLAIESGSAALASGNVTWLSYTLHNTKLILSARNAYLSFHRECARISPNTTIHSDPAVLEASAAHLQSAITTHIAPWIASVPDGLKTKRKPGCGDPFSPFIPKQHHQQQPSRPLALEPFSPPWLQRHRLLLELLHHHLSIILHRQLISFSLPSSLNPNPNPNNTTNSINSTPAASACAQTCAHHAITLTHLLHQIFSETDLLAGYQEAFQWLWNSTITLVGFILAYDANRTSPSSNNTDSTTTTTDTPSDGAGDNIAMDMGTTLVAAREAVGLAIDAFEVFGRGFEVGTRAARVVRELRGLVEGVLGQVQGHTGQGQVHTGQGQGGNIVVGGGGGGDGVVADSAGDLGGVSTNPGWDAGLGGSGQGLDGGGNLGILPTLGFGANMNFGLELQDLLSGTMDVAFSVDSFPSFELLQGGSLNFPDLWPFAVE